jgi:hypothetical protein
LEAGKRYNLVPHAVSVSAGTAVANAFLSQNGTVLLYPVSLATSSKVTLELRGVPSSVTGFEATYPGTSAGSWSKVAGATKGGGGSKGGGDTWQVTVAFSDSRTHHAVRLISAYNGSSKQAKHSCELHNNRPISY